MSNVLTSLGVKFYLGARDDTDAEPSSLIPQVIESSEIDLDPDTIETTSFDNMRYKSSVAGLIDTSGIQALTVNATEDEEAEAVWDSFAGKPAWLKIVIPHKADNTYIPIIPIKTGAYNVVINDRITIRLKYTIAGDMLFGETLAKAIENEGGESNLYISGIWDFKRSESSIALPLDKRIEQLVNYTYDDMGQPESGTVITYEYSSNPLEYILFVDEAMVYNNADNGWTDKGSSEFSDLDFGSTPQRVSADFMKVWTAFATKREQ